MQRNSTIIAGAKFKFKNRFSKLCTTGKLVKGQFWHPLLGQRIPFTSPKLLVGLKVCLSFFPLLLYDPYHPIISVPLFIEHRSCNFLLFCYLIQDLNFTSEKKIYRMKTQSSLCPTCVTSLLLCLPSSLKCTWLSSGFGKDQRSLLFDFSVHHLRAQYLDFPFSDAASALG